MGTGTPAYAECRGTATEPTDHALVAAVRQGDDRAFERLFERYQRRITTYVVGMVSDHGRAEDITQEIFISALRRMRQTERPIAFRPWIYEIAKNACIDQYRRSRRRDDISFDAADEVGPADYGRLVERGPTPDAIVAQKQALHDLKGAFGGLSDTHHQILVLRELEGLSYREIGERLEMTSASVESALFRARRRLSEEYDDLASGRRCLAVQALLGTTALGALGARDRRRLGHHVAHCQPCRRQARNAGVDMAAVTRAAPRRVGLGGRIAGLLPLPATWRERRGAGDEVAAQVATLAPAAEPVAQGLSKIAAAGAIVLAGLGAGAGSEISSRLAPPAKQAAPAPTPERSAPRSLPPFTSTGSLRSVPSGGGGDGGRPAVGGAKPTQRGAKPTLGLRSTGNRPKPGSRAEPRVTPASPSRPAGQAPGTPPGRPTTARPNAKPETGEGRTPASTPAVRTPALDVPAVRTPEVRVPEATVPAVRVPAVKAPAAEVPTVEAPPVRVPVVKVPPVQTPALKVPAVEAPPVQVPAVKLP